MTLTDGLQRFESKLVSRMRDTFEDTRRAYRQRRTFRSTYSELNALSERELNDLGLARGDIRGVAWAATLKK